jgi:hypothetical protein
MESKKWIESGIFISFFIVVFIILLIIYNCIAPNDTQVFMKAGSSLIENIHLDSSYLTIETLAG